MGKEEEVNRWWRRRMSIEKDGKYLGHRTDFKARSLHSKEIW